ncbi:MAG: ComF family protein [Myxococcota bacterium]
MLEVLTCLGTDACVACDRSPTVASAGALNGQLCRACLAEVPARLSPLGHAPPGIAGGWYLGPYGGPVGAMVRAGKYGGNEAVLWALGRHCAWGEQIEDVDVVVAVPSSPWRRLVRGMNPADLLACPVASCLGLPLMHPLVRRRSAPQAAQTRSRRAANARGAYAAVAPIAGRVLLVDDVLTTGATAQACAEELLGAGADEVRLLVIAAAANRSIPVS